MVLCAASVQVENGNDRFEISNRAADGSGAENSGQEDAESKDDNWGHYGNAG